MTKYAPLPSIQLDPRNEAELIRQAATRAYIASNGRLNDFSSGSALMVLLEAMGWTFARFLYWLNQLPEAFVIEWLGPLLGVQRRLGTPSKATVEVIIEPHPDIWVMRQGYVMRARTQDLAFTTDEPLVLQPGESRGIVNVTCTEIGSTTNLPEGEITVFTEALAFLKSVKSISPARGGSDAETLIDTRERAYRYIARRNPVNEEQWREFIESILGKGATAVIRTRRPSIDVINPNAPGSANHVSFWLLDANGEALTPAALREVKTKIDLHMPTGLDSHVYNIDTQDVDLAITVSYDAIQLAAKYANESSATLAFAKDIQRSLYKLMLPGKNFPVGDPVQLHDITTLWSNEYSLLNPNLEDLVAYSIPVGINSLETNYRNWQTGFAYTQYDLLIDNGNFYEVSRNFNAVGSRPQDWVLSGEMKLVRTKNWDENRNFPLRPGDVLSFKANPSSLPTFHIVQETITQAVKQIFPPPVSWVSTINQLIATGKLSMAVTPREWSSTGQYNVNDIINVYTDGVAAPNQKYVVLAEFTARDLGNIQSAIEQGELRQVYPVPLTEETNYVAGDYIWQWTPEERQAYYRVQKNFLFRYGSSVRMETFRGNLRPAALRFGYPGENSAATAYRYRARFGVGEYLAHPTKSASGQLNPGQLYQAMVDFTPGGESIEAMIAQGKLAPVYDFTAASVKWRQIYDFLVGDLVVIDSSNMLYEVTKPFTPVIPDPQVYINNGSLKRSSTLISATTQRKEFFDRVKSDVIPENLTNFNGAKFFSGGTSSSLPANSERRAFDFSLGTSWLSSQLGSDCNNNAFIGVDFGADATVKRIDLQQATTSAGTSDYQIQVSSVGQYGPWTTVYVGQASAALQTIELPSIRGRYWRVISAGSKMPQNGSPWQMYYIRFNGTRFDVLGMTQFTRKEDLILEFSDNTERLYRVMKTFTPVADLTPRQAEQQGYLMKVVEKYYGNNYIAVRNDHAALHLGLCEVILHPLGQPQAKSHYLFERKTGDLDPAVTLNGTLIYGGGTISL